MQIGPICVFFHWLIMRGCFCSPFYYNQDKNNNYLNFVVYNNPYNNSNSWRQQRQFAVAKLSYVAHLRCPCLDKCNWCQTQQRPNINFTPFTVVQGFNPCPEGKPLTVNGLPLRCTKSESLPSKCPTDYFCHVNVTIDTTCCCPQGTKAENLCFQPLEPGSGEGVSVRYYFQAETGTCQQFWFRGSGGNQNNFLSLLECEATCKVSTQQPSPPPIIHPPVVSPEPINPCRLGRPLTDASGRYFACRYQSTFQDTCGAKYWCHYGASVETTVCCPGAFETGSICNLPASPGLGIAELTRWYYDPYARDCIPFQYNGLQGNQNNFLTRESCHIRCQGAASTTAASTTIALPPSFPENPCPIGSPAMSGNQKPMLCVFKSGCGADYWCHIGGRAETTVCCPGALQVACTGIRPEPGIGEYHLPRWYYDASVRQCFPFGYRGMKGNQNNFFTKEDCETACGATQEEQPCVYTAKIPQGCSVLNPICSDSSHWCHIGASSATTTCCAGATDNPCFEPLAVGNGQAALTRYFFNSVTRQCENFIYSGSKGNQNNFLSFQDCESRCKRNEQDSNVCPLGQPLASRNGQLLTCDQFAGTSTCPLGYWCHVGSPEQLTSTTACCPKTTDNVCSLALSAGQGAYSLARYFYDPIEKRCKPFVYTGAKGNENNFASAEVCEAACGEYTNPCIGQPATAFSNQTIFCSAANKDVCPVNFWCHVGATVQTTLCCPGATLPCTVPLAPGTGEARLQRWYYNADKRTCEQFEYFGLGGNQNNFASLNECEKLCPSELCALSIDWGTPCHEPPVIRYAYDRASKSCVAFTFNGCGGNLNSFSTMQECSAVCSGTAYRRKKRFINPK